jgi:S-adenosylmethionine:tRNA ribosyltransferase-isomerase
MTPNTQPKPFTLSDFDYPLPEDLIARYPLPQRDASRMLVVNRTEGTLTDSSFQDFPDFCHPGDVVVINNAKVLPVRLIGHREGYTGEVEIFLMHPQNEARTEWLALTRPAKKLRTGTLVCFPNSDLRVDIREPLEDGQARVTLHWSEGKTLEETLERAGQLPLPPYLQRAPEASDSDRYQTIFAKAPGAQAAPTAGLHFTQNTFSTLKNKGVDIVEVSLLVSAGTFRPVTHNDISAHTMAEEAYELSADTATRIQAAKARGNRVITIGTTSTKTLETVAHEHHGELLQTTGWSSLFITPGFRFQIADTMLTNFHLPKSTLLMMVSAFSDRELILKAYEHAIAEKYRFYSYGDCMLLV